MYRAYFDNGVIIEGANVQVVYKAAESERRYRSSILDDGLHGYRLEKDGIPFFTIKAGKDMTITELEASVRLYNTMLRRALTDGLVPKGTRELTVGQLYNFLIAGQLYKVRNAGTKTYLELFDLIHKCIGWSDEIQRVFENCISDSPMGIRWLNQHVPNWGRYE